MRVIAPRQVLDAHPGGVWSICVCSPSRIVSGGADGWLKAWEVDPGTGHLAPLGQVSTPHSEVVLVRRSQQGALISAGHHGGLAVWDWEPTRGVLTSRQRLSTREDREEHSDRLLETRAGHLIAWASLARSAPSVWQWAELEQSFVFRQSLPIERVSSVLEIPSGELVSGDGDGRIRFWRWDEPTARWQATEVLQAHDGPIHAMVMIQGGELISAGGSEPLLKVWRRPAYGKELALQQSLSGHRSSILDLVAPNSTELISSDQGTRLFALGWRHKPELRVWRQGAAGWELVQRQLGRMRRCLEGDLLVDEQGEGLSLWRRVGATYQKSIALAGGHRGMVLAAERLPWGGLVTGSGDGSLACWDVVCFQGGDPGHRQLPPKPSTPLSGASH